MKSNAAKERQDNFRWLSKLVGSYADCEPLKSNTLVPEDTKERVDEIGQYSELIYSYVPVKELFENHHLLKEEGILLEYQAVFDDCNFLRYIEGEKTNLSAFVVCRRSMGQLVVSISGSTRFKHMKYNLHATHTPWPGAPLPAPSDDSLAENEASPRTTSRKDLTETLQAEIRNQSPQELIITGHSMGGSVSYLLCMDLLEKHSEILPATVSGNIRRSTNREQCPRTALPNPRRSVQIQGGVHV
ncbi:hypothetical protein FA13DRAFT_1730401 [Coprinellus micaceus]|uniref:Fungal lipase-type domain-containing protein n=1 Tax=Coprinellus micaceus TaxID=71717 RepID=A0A4Y7TGU8_COPMI|nr:hypothetical protein FA13DRAFT_1730401 [Coprinellus micaceus]